VVYDSLIHGHADAVKWGPLVAGDLCDRAALDAALREHRPEAVLHFAGLIAVGESVADPGRYYRANVTGSLTLLEAMRDHGLSQLVFSSTAAVYGLPETVPIPEDHRLLPINPYGTTKLVMERMLADFGAAHGLRSVALRYFNAAGADPEGELGERHHPETHAIPLAIFAVLGRRPHFQVFGTDYPTPDGSAVRDYIHVSDLAAAHVAALEHLAQGGPGGAFNLGTGIGTSVLELVRAVERQAGRPVPVRICPRRAGDPPSLIAAPGRAAATLGWRPLWTDIDAIVGSAWRWFAASPAPGPAETA
jgi:UDP-glucose-4-epimerase GalE